MCATFNVISFSTIDVYIITCRTFTLNMIHVLKFVSFSYIMYLYYDTWVAPAIAAQAVP